LRRRVSVAVRSSSLPAWPAGRPLRAWQRSALAALEAHAGDTFLASATPAAGKTTFGLRVAHAFLASGRARRVAVVAPTAHIGRQWAADAARYGLDLEPNRPNADGPEPADRHGVCVTYQAVAAAPRLHGRAARARETLLIADEPHHMGDHAAWGLRAREAFGPAVFRLLLSGTPFRSDNSPIPWVRYDDDGVSRADFAYGYTRALVDRVCRPITFHPYDGDMEWISDGRLRRADFSLVLPAQEAARRLRTALEPDGDWMGEVLRDADARLSEVRASAHRDAAGLVVAADKEHAGRIAARLARVAGEAPMVVTSDDPGASAAIARFGAGAQRWLVSVLMVSEGVDIPRLRVGVYATAARTELFFRQVVGRFIRRTAAPAEQMSHLLMPADPALKALATRIEEERDHVLEVKPEGEAREAVERGEARTGYEALSSSGARVDDLITVAPGENFALFGAPEPASSVHLDAFGGHVAGAGAASAAGPSEPTHARRERLRAERSTLVAALARRTGASHREINARLNRDVGAPSVGKATLDQLERANVLLARRVGRR
jgi:superfamily II DNA or RNA helicase